MKYLIAIFVLAMVVKDIRFIGDPYWLRGFSQVGMLIVGITLLLTKYKGSLLKKQWLIICYILMLFLSVLFSPFKTYTLLQVVSFLGPISFYLGLTLYGEVRRAEFENTFYVSIIAAYSIAGVFSLVIYKINPVAVTQWIYGDGFRFTGIFSAPAMTAVSGGVLVGLTAFRPMNIFLKIIIMAVGTACVLLTLSRTFAVALVIALLVTSWMYFPKHRKWYGFGVFAAAILMIVVSVFNVSLSKDNKKEIDNISRSDSITNLSGRTYMWTKVFEGRSKQPFVGEGYTMGGLLLMHSKKTTLNTTDIDPRKIGRATLHSGYIQALADLAYPGFIIYTAIILLAVLRPLLKDKNRRHPVLFYSALFMLIANSCESVIYTASNFYSIYFWFVAIFLNSYYMGAKEKKLSGTK